jgi:predicted PurR-regulated permease PerM
MATRQIRNLINRMDKEIFSIENKLDEEKQKRVSKIKENVPNKEEIKQKFTTTACSPIAQKRIEQIYNKLHNKIGKLENIGESGKEKLNNLLSKINKIKDKILPKIESVLEFLKTYVVPILIVAIILAEVILNLPARYTTGRAIKFLISKIDKAKTKIKEYLGLAKTILKYIPKYVAKALLIIGAIGAIIAILSGILAFMKKMKAFLEYLYLKYVKKCTISNQTPIDSDGNINEDTLVDNITDNDMPGIIDTMTTLYNDLLEDLKDNNQTQVIERLTNTKFGFRTSYEVKTISIL